MNCISSSITFEKSKILVFAYICHNSLAIKKEVNNLLNE